MMKHKLDKIIEEVNISNYECNCSNISNKLDTLCIQCTSGEVIIIKDPKFMKENLEVSKLSSNESIKEINKGKETKVIKENQSDNKVKETPNHDSINFPKNLKKSDLLNTSILAINENMRPLLSARIKKREENKKI